MNPGSGTNASPTYTLLDSWSFRDSTNWPSDNRDAPVSFTNLAGSDLGDGFSLVVDSPSPAWLQYHVVETSGATNFSPAVGTISFWFAPESWSSTNAGGPGPGESGRLFEVGSYTTNSSFGWWSLYVDPAGNNLYFSTQTNDLSSTSTTYLAVPITWKTNYFHNVVVTYSATNTALYLDGGLATNGPGLTVYPGPNALAKGLFIGSDSNGVAQAHGLFNNVVTYNAPLDSGTIRGLFQSEYPYYLMNPVNRAMALLTSANSTPADMAAYNAISGAGYLQWVANLTNCVSSANALQVWVTNVLAATAGDGSMTVTFTIAGGQDNVPYDVFANSVLGFPPCSSPAWAWLGQGCHCTTYRLTGLPNGTVYLILCTPQDSDGDGLTDAYELLASKTDPHNPDTSGDGMADSDKVLLNLNPLSSNPVLPANPVIQTCPQ